MIATEKDIPHLREAGKRLARVLDAVVKEVRPGVTTGELDALAEQLIRAGGDLPAFKGYQPSGADFPFPATLCTSVNDEVVHGLPGERTLEDGDIIGLDIGLSHEGYIVDMARTIPVGTIDAETAHLLAVTKKALMAGIKAASAGARVGDISAAVESEAEDYGIVRELGGHAVGKKVHERPFIPNFGPKGKGPVLPEGMVIAIEPMLNAGGDDVFVTEDGYTYKTKDGSRSAHFEHTVLVTKKGAEILTA